MRTFPLNSHPGHFSRVRQSKNFLISRTPCVSCRNNRIFSLRIVNSFLRLFFHTFRPRPHVSGYFWKRRFLCPLSKKNASLIFRPNWGPKGPKKIFGDHSPIISGSGWLPPLIWRSGSTTELAKQGGGNWSRFQTDTCGRGVRKKLYKKIHKKEIYIRSNQSTLQVSY